MKIVRVDQRLAVELPADTVRDLNLHEGDDVSVSVWKQAKPPVPEPDDGFSAIRRLRGRLPADFKFDREEANAR